MRITITKRDKDDRLDIERGDGSRVSTTFPKKGPMPHDVVHYAVERELGFDRGFWGLVASGIEPAQVQVMAKAAGHASASRAEPPSPDFVQAIQAERTVEAFEADHWSGASGEPAGVIAMARSGCEQSLVPPTALDCAGVERVRACIADVARRWSMLAPGQSLVLEWPCPA